MKTATYPLLAGGQVVIEYDEKAPCIGCGLPVVEASMGGTALCPWCDTGKNRDGTPIEYRMREATVDELAAGKGSVVFDNAYKATIEEYAAALAGLPS